MLSFILRELLFKKTGTEAIQNRIGSRRTKEEEYIEILAAVSRTIRLLCLTTM